MAIYTKTGDKGETKVFDKKTQQLVKISKNSKKISAIGNIDELNSFLGIVGDLINIQSCLFTINAILAGSKLRLSKTNIKSLEKEIDKLEGNLPVLKNFIYYGGSVEAAHLFYARALCRRAERSLIRLSSVEAINPEIIRYMNRLSDYLFMKAREQNFKQEVKEKAWKR